jgi:single-strand DNA-binding protein
MLNQLQMQGRLVASPELKQTANGKNVLTFSIASQRTYTPKGQDKISDFFECVAWEKTAEFISRYFKKGDLLIICGYLQSRNYEDKQGNKRKVVEIVVEKAEFSGSKGAEHITEPTTEPNDDLPF